MLRSTLSANTEMRFPPTDPLASVRDNVTCLIGNHEMMMDHLNRNRERGSYWTMSANGGTITKRDFNNLSDQEKSRIIDYLNNLYLQIELESNGKKFLLSHSSFLENLGTVRWRDLDEKIVFKTVWDTGAAGGIAYGTAFVSTAISQSMSSSSQQLIKSLGKSGVPAAVISFGVQSYDSVIDYAEGVIDGKQLAYDLGENAAQVGGSIAGAALAGAAVGSVVPGAGTAVGFGVGMVGGMIGCAVASEAYASAVEFGSEHAGVLADKAQEMANHTVDLAKDIVPDKVGNIVASLNNYAITVFDKLIPPKTALLACL